MTNEPNRREASGLTKEQREALARRIRQHGFAAYPMTPKLTAQQLLEMQAALDVQGMVEQIEARKQNGLKTRLRGQIF